MGTDETSPSSIAGLIVARAREAPDAHALAAPGRAPLTYGRLAGHCEQVRTVLRDAGVGPGGRVAVLLPNGPELASAFVAVASAAGCAPLNPAYRESELDFFLTDLHPDALILEEGASIPAVEVARRLSVPTISLAPLRSGPAGLFDLDAGAGSQATNGAAPGPDDVGLLLHTSGTTSRPKLVPLAHRNLCASATSVARVLELGRGDRCLNVMPLFHIHGLVAAVLASLWAGGTTVCGPGFDANAFFRSLEEEEPSWYTAVPTIHQAILARAGSHRAAVERAGLRFVRSSSAPLPPRVLAELEDLFSCPAIEAYGMTEAAHQMTSNPLPPGARKPGSVGLPAGVEVAILDASGAEVGAGSVGEVAVRGPGVFFGYEANSVANEEAFTTGWFRTGDLGVLDADGYLFLHGRLKEVINRGGEKISPLEVDEVLLDHPAVAQAVTFAFPHDRLGEEVAAAVVLREGVSVAEADLQRFATDRLADFKVPRKVVFLDELPKGATGKVQRVGLAERLGLDAGASGATGPPFVAPRTPLERALASRFEELLDVSRPVGVNHDFFDLGGDSIASAELLAWIAEAGLGSSELPASTLLWAPTVERLAEALEGRREPPDGPIIEITVGGTKPPLYFVHPHDGDLFIYGSLARRLTGSHPFHGIGAEHDPGPKSVEGLADAYVEAVRAAQPRGPYYVGGRCMGGAIALEMARALTALGQQVALVALVDPVGESPNVLRYYWRRFWYFRERRQVFHRLVRLRRIRRELESERRLRRATEPPMLTALRHARDAYVARPYGGRIALLRGEYYLTPPSFWKRIAAQGVDAFPPYRPSPGERATGDLADQLDRALLEADARLESEGTASVTLRSADVDDDDRDWTGAERARPLREVDRGEADLTEAAAEEDGAV